MEFQKDYTELLNTVYEVYNAESGAKALEAAAEIVERIKILQQAGINDSLTGLPNRRGFEERLAVEWERAIREQTPISLLFIDIDDFKTYNDACGHAFGDLLIKEAAKVFKQTLQRAIDFTARWGGDEFAVLLPATDSNGACEIASKVLRNMQNNAVLHSDGRAVNITVSIGIGTVFPRPSDEPSAFLEKADKALYSAKEAGRNRYCLHEA